MAEIKKAIKFGFLPQEDEYHFLVVIPTTREKNQNVRIYERFYYDENLKKQEIDSSDRLKSEISKEKWDKISSFLEKEFKERLKNNNISYAQAKWTTGDNFVERLFGKELLVLVWAIEDCEESVIDTAIINWKGLDTAERWWLYTMTNASTGGAYDKRGWRKAIRYALCENPIEEVKRYNYYNITKKRKNNDCDGIEQISLQI